MNLINYSFSGFEVRVLVLNSQQYFVARDVAELLGYKDTRKSIADNCPTRKSLKEILEESGTKKDGKAKINIKTNLIKEEDVWALIMKSQKPNAKKFKEWVIKEVLPTINSKVSEQTKAIEDKQKDVTMGIENIKKEAKSQKEVIDTEVIDAEAVNKEVSQDKVSHTQSGKEQNAIEHIPSITITQSEEEVKFRMELLAMNNTFENLKTSNKDKVTAMRKLYEKYGLSIECLPQLQEEATKRKKSK